MAYQFEKSSVASVKITDWRLTDDNTLTLQGINGAMSSADSLVAGVQQLLSIVGMQNQFTPENMVRVVTERVVVSD